jgi:hypothetical protein
VTAGWCFRSYADGIALTAHPENNLVAIGAELRMLHAAGLNENKAAHWLTLHEQELVTRKNPRLCARGDLLGLLMCKSGEER